RAQGRDLFDLYHALLTDASIDARAIVDAFVHYMERERTRAHRGQFVALLEGRLRDRGFRSDMHSLLRPGIEYDVQAAAALVKERLLSLLPPEPGGPARPRAQTRPRK
ncbi:MAG TPA: nucleotidyl transferase AbiEii/AbiGii toxin family protein, partial [Burkholderiales bacterium]|nr:nucleotidyl transferase AbiEii/AbiGii toxin family protein [Burkholderiales bacterium]